MGKVTLFDLAFISLITVGLCALSTRPAVAQTSSQAVKVNPLRDAYYGDLHLHTSYSFDAYLMGTGTDPDKAYRFAKGEAVEYLGQSIRRREPLDFMSVTDHAENIGIWPELRDPNSPFSRSEIGNAMRAAEAKAGPISDPSVYRFFRAGENFQGAASQSFRPLPPALKAESVSAWQREIDFANRNYQPGKFTTFIAYEWGAQRKGSVLHRNVIFKGNSAPYPFSSLDSMKPEDLWAWLEANRKKGYEALAIPHNGNESNGLMYDWVDSNGRPIDLAYAERRAANEPLSEISQIKGSSETHPLMPPADEFSDFEIFDSTRPLKDPPPHPEGSYLRDALSRGMILQRQLGANPYKYGFVGASDLHTGLSVNAQADYIGDEGRANLGPTRPTKEQAAVILEQSKTWNMVATTSGNMTGVWAESNTRESIYSALRRKETFATSGTRLKFRFFGGWGFEPNLIQQKNWVATAYDKGVPMGGDLPARSPAVKAPSFVVWAVKDPNNANLDRVQVVKVWEEDGKQKERVFDVVWSGNRKPNAKTGKLPSVGNTVDLKTGKYSNNIGATELMTVWEDPDFHADRLAAYYLRVLEIPTPRWSTLLAIEHGLPLPEGVPATEEQRGWSSPIWYTPRGARQ